MNKSLKTILFSIDYVFIELIKKILNESSTNHNIIVKSLFSEAKTTLNNEDIDLIIVDDAIIGTSSYELISYLRLHQKIICPMIYFGVPEYNGERKALLTGSSYFLKKPFNPKSVTNAFKKILSKNNVT